MNTQRTRPPLTNVLLSVIIVLLTGILFLQVVRMRNTARGSHPPPPDPSRAGQSVVPRLTPQLAAQQGSPLSSRAPDLNDFWQRPETFEEMHARAQQILREARAQFEQMGKEMQGNDATQPLAPPPAFRAMEEQFNSMFEQAVGDMAHFGLGLRFDDGWNDLAPTPALDVREDGSNYVVDVGLGAMDDPQVKLSLRGDILQIEAGQDKVSPAAASGGEADMQTVSHQHFARAIRLPGATADIDAIQTSYNNGVLRIVVPRVRDAKPLERQIRIK